MSYTKLNLRNGHVLNQTDMAHIEDGIYNNDSAIEAIEDEIGSEELSGTILNKIGRNASDITDIKDEIGTSETAGTILNKISKNASDITDIKDDIGTAETEGTILNKISKNTAEINQLKGIGKFLSNWNCVTGKPYSDPSTLPYTYNTGDYYVITNIAETGPDYRPSGTTYTGAASTALEEQDVKVGDFYIFDATEWLLMVNVPRTVTGGAGITVSNNEVSVNYSTGLEVTNGVLSVDTDTIQTKITSSNKVSAFNVDGLATVATSGSYNDLSDKPTIPTITIDDALSSSSTNPVQNKVINSALNNKQDTLNTDQKRKITISTSSPTGGSNGDIWLKYTG